MTAPAAPESSIPTIPGLAEVRYSMPQMLKELEAERAAGAFAMEKLGQTEIAKMFKARKRTRRVKARK
ncbi:MAG TPA: hypothetical protein VHE13_09005 [Opitutus sp.]|nr:hypothetical protein [Opitutus sp.]